MKTSHHKWTTIVVFLSLVAGACGAGSNKAIAPTDGSPANERFVFPVRQEALSPPETDLPNGFRVAEGSWLLGTVFPDHISTTSVSSGVFGPRETEHKEWYDWRALLALTGSVEDTVNRYAEQAGELGFQTKATAVICDSGARVDRCGFRARHDDSSTERPVWFSATAARAPNAKSGWPTAYVQLQVTGAGNTEKPDPVPLLATDQAPAQTPPPSPEGELTSQTEPFTDLQFELDEEPLGPRVELKIEDGSTLVAPPTYDMGAKGQSEVLAVLALASDARALMDAYTEQATEFYPAEDVSESWQWGQSHVVEMTRMCRGPCGAYIAKAVIGPDDSGYMLIRLMLRPQ